ncbi:hypothetical protein SAY87_006470 [Trapa incisa]|uniref:Uncharacterized protein n=1 Tax=Trapa incisa TaxID=236973 RepID=A0AAN7JWL5_9MYRT|nr:hypothetical protein SAY87_006470 [Trapa incisa]
MTALNRLDRQLQQSRKSTHTRQRQYFEQRKRRQQQQATDTNNFSDEMHRYGQLQKAHHQSLDILNFLNCFTTEHHQGSGIGKLKDIDSEIEAQTAHGLSVASVDAKTHLCPVELKSADVSIMDFLGDDGTDINPEVKPVYEEHVAFSVHGLGRMGAETPINSPQRRSRTFSYGDFSPSKVDDLDLFLDHINTSNEHDHKYKEDPSMPYANFACRMTPGSFSFSEDVWDPFSIPVQETSRIFDNVKYNMDDSRQNLSFGCKSPCCTGTPARKFSSEIDCSYIMLDDPNDSLSSKSFGSEESCSSTAERGQMSSSSTLNADMRKPLNKYTSATWLRSNIPKSRDHEKISFPVKPKRSLDSDMQSNKLFDVNDPLLERPHEDSEFSSFHVTTKRKTTPTVCGRSVAQSLSAIPEADFFTEDQRPFDQPEHYLDPVRYTYSSSFMFATFAFGKGFKQVNYHGFHCLFKDISVKGRSCGDGSTKPISRSSNFKGFT